MNNVFSIEQIFTERLLRIPDYQRGYAWDQSQLNEFIEDIELLPPGKHHYTGTLVLHTIEAEPHMDDEGRNYLLHDVVDGQQRLTTIVILLDTVRRTLALHGLQKLAEGVRNTYVHATGLDGQPLHKLTLNSDCHGFFVSNVLADMPGPAGPQIYSHQRLRGARRHFEAYLEEKGAELGDGFKEWLIALRHKVTQQLKVVLYTVDDAAEVSVVFETMNNRGKQLTELEKVKNYLLYLTTKLDVPSASVRNTINDSWATIFKNLMAAGLSDTEDQILRAHWLMAYSPRTRDWKQSKSIKDAFGLKAYQGNHKALVGDIMEYAKTLRDASLAFCDIMMPSRSESFSAFDTSPDVRAAIKHVSDKLRRLDNIAPFLPLLIAARLRFSGVEGADSYLRIVRLCEKFSFRVYGLAEKKANAGQSALFSLGHKLFTKAIESNDISASVCWYACYYCPDKALVENFASVGDWYSWPKIKYFLYEYEEYLAMKARVQVVPWKQIQVRKREDSIEHILPQSPSDAYWLDRFTAEERERLTHDLGNLCLTFNNSSYGRKPFPDKRGAPGQMKPCYANSNLVIERVLAQLDDWTVQAILDRRTEIASWAAERWKVDAPSVEPPVTEDDEEEGY